MTKEEALKIIDKRDRLKAMYEETTFKEIIIEGYCKEEPARLAQALCNAEMQDEIDQRSLNEMIRGIGHFHNFLRNDVRQGNNIEVQLNEAEAEAQAELLREARTMEVYPITGD